MKKRRISAAVTAFIVTASMLLSGCGDNSASSGGSSLADNSSTVSQGDSSNADTSQTSGDDNENPSENRLTEEQMQGMNALQLSVEMGNGINLGNTMEAYNHNAYLSGGDPTFSENVWGQPTTTKQMIDDMKKMGFDTLRIPVAWTNAMNYESGDYTIDKRYLDRVAEIVNYALDNDMFVIVNDHWDGSWWGMFGNKEMQDKAMEMYKSMWTQIGEYFADYSYRLIFESANEELGDRLNDSDVTGSKGTLSKNECYEKTNEINAEFVKVIRSLGGKNADRFLLIAGYNTDIAHTTDDKYIMPEDTADGKLFVSVHYYTPWDYCGTDAIEKWGSPNDYKEQSTLLESMTKFTEKGYGVIIGEYAVMHSSGKLKPESDKFYRNFLNNCDLYNFCPVLWDCSNLYKRALNQITDETVAKLFSDRQRANEPEDYEQVKSAAQAELDKDYKTAEDEFSASVSVPASDDYAVAWIMFQSSDWKIAYSVGDTYDPTNKTAGVKDRNAKIEGEGTYTIGLDFTECGGAKGTAFSAIGISHGEEMFPGYCITIEEILIDGQKFEMNGKNYTSSDDGKCTRSNLYNQWVNTAPAEARVADGDKTDLSAQIMDLGKTKFNTIDITFTFTAP